MSRYAIFEKLSGSLTGDLRAGHYALTGDSDGSAGQPRPQDDSLWIDRRKGLVHAPDGNSADLLRDLGYGIGADDFQEPRDAVLRIGIPGLFARAVATVLPERPSEIVEHDSMRFAALSLQDVVALLIEALALLGRLNARRSLDTLTADAASGITAVILEIRLIEPPPDKES